MDISKGDPVVILFIALSLVVFVGVFLAFKYFDSEVS